MSDIHAEPTKIIATLAPSIARFWVAFIAIFCFALLLLWVAATGAAGSMLGSLLFLAMSGLAFYGANAIYKIKGASLTLTEDGLFDQSGRVLCRMEDIASLDRSFFAMKPSNGFVIKLKKSADRAWVPGLWWRFGKRVGVGGVTSVPHAKFMADTLTLRLNASPEVLGEDQSPLAR